MLVVSFARERLDELKDPIAAALEAGFVRMRPVLMTALAMVIGMGPMALGLGEGGEQTRRLAAPSSEASSSPLSRPCSLFPVVFSIVHRRTHATASAPLAGEPHVA